MMVDINVICKAAEIGLSVASSIGANVVVKEAVKHCTPQNLSAAKEFGVTVMKGAATGIVAGACRKYIKEEIGKTKKVVEKVMTEFNMNHTDVSEAKVEIVETATNEE